MTPKEKSQELFGKFAMYLRANLMYDEDANEDAKQCALIAVDEMLEEFENIFSIFTDKNSPRLIYFREVKKEIEKL